MKQEVNATKFEKNDPGFIEFFNEHGWVVLKGNLTSDVIQGGLGQWANLKKRYADEMGLSLIEYENEVSQWRNLWHNEKGYFRDLILGKHGLGGRSTSSRPHYLQASQRSQRQDSLASGFDVLACEFPGCFHMDTVSGCVA